MWTLGKRWQRLIRRRLQKCSILRDDLTAAFQTYNIEVNLLGGLKLDTLWPFRPVWEMSLQSRDPARHQVTRSVSILLIFKFEGRNLQIVQYCFRQCSSLPHNYLRWYADSHTTESIEGVTLRLHSLLTFLFFTRDFIEATQMSSHQVSF